MNVDQLKGNWQKLTGNIKAEFGKLSDDDVMQAEGNIEILLGTIQEKYGIGKEEAKEKLDAFLQKVK